MTKLNFQQGFFCSLLIGAFSFCMLPDVAVADQCGKELYSSSGDYSYTYPLPTPSAEFSKTLKAATKGDVLEQRNLAADYEGGYLVTICNEKAEYWYRRAAKGGDKIARDWVAARDTFAKFAAGPECIGPMCDTDAEDGAQVLALVADPRGHFHSDLTINGVTVNGIIDTGASTIAMSAATATAMGITPDGTREGRSVTANGIVKTFEKMVLSVRVGNITLNNVQISILPDTPTLIGMSVLRRLKISAANGQMTLSK